jgi:uncharacterized protein
MSRLLFWIALAVLVVMAVRSKLRAAKMRGAAPAPGTRSGASAVPDGDAEAMACCDQCGVYFPASEAVRADGRDYCCAAHVRPTPVQH